MNDLAKLHKPTRLEAAKLAELIKRTGDRPSGPALRLSIKDGGKLNIDFAPHDRDMAVALLMADLGTTEPAFLNGIIAQLAVIGSHGTRIDESNSNFLLSVVRGLEPRDQMEAMLAAQMAAVHAAMMMMARRLNHVETIPQQDAAERALNKGSVRGRGGILRRVGGVIRGGHRGRRLWWSLRTSTTSRWRPR